VADRAELRRRELAVFALGLTVALMCTLVGVDAVRHHAGPAMTAAAEWRLGLATVSGLAVVAVIVADGLALLLGARSIARQAWRQRAFLRRLPVQEVRPLHGATVSMVAGSQPRAFCAGLVRPRVFVSTGALRRLEPLELRAVIAHEAEHARRRDPLRLMLVRAVADAFPFLPALSRLASQQAAIAELAADAAAVHGLGSRQAVAAAIVAFGDAGAGEIAPERVDRLAGRAPVRVVSRALLVVVGTALAGLTTLTFCTLLLPDHFVPLAPPAPLCSLAVVLPLSGPALIACRRA
jgi:Zn-dependent protease with chaperone function